MRVQRNGTPEISSPRNIRKRPHDAIGHGFARIYIFGLDGFPSSGRVSSRCIHGLRAYRPRGAPGYAAVVTLRAVAGLCVALHAVYDCRAGYRHNCVRSGSVEKPPANP